MGNSTSKRKIKHSRSKSEMKTAQNTHKYRARSPTEPGDTPADLNNDSTNLHSKNDVDIHPNPRRVLSLNDIGNHQPNMNILLPNNPESLVTAQISIPSSGPFNHTMSNSNTNTPLSSMDNIIDNTIDNTNTSHLNNINNDLSNHYRQYTHRMQNSGSNTVTNTKSKHDYTITATTYTTYNNKITKTPTLPDPNYIADFGLDDDEAYTGNNNNNNKPVSYLSPSMEPEPVPKSVKSIDSIPLSAISKISVSNSGSGSGSITDSGSGSDSNQSLPIKFSNYYSEPNQLLFNEFENKKYKKRIKKDNNFNNNNRLNQTGLIKVRSTPNLKRLNVSNNNSNNLDVINDKVMNINISGSDIESSNIYFVNSGSDSDEEIKKMSMSLTPPPPSLNNQSQSVNANFNINYNNYSNSNANVLTSVNEKQFKNKLKLIKSRSDKYFINSNQNQNQNQHQNRTYRSKYTTHYKISLAKDKQNYSMKKRKNIRSNSECVKDFETLPLKHRNSKDLMIKKKKKKKGQEKRKQNLKNIKLKNEKVVVLCIIYEVVHIH